jgi:hypothetical protein
MREITHSRRAYRASNSTETPRLSNLCCASHPGISERVMIVAIARYGWKGETGNEIASHQALDCYRRS